jgi:hypothetical protein
MLEMFFDDEKIFSVFERMIKEDSDEICFPKICFSLGIDPSVAANILQSFLFLDILQETKKSEKKGIFTINKDSVVVLALCFFDEVVGKHCLKKVSDVIDEGFDLDNDNGEDVSVQEISFEEFLEDILGNEK